MRQIFGGKRAFEKALANKIANFGACSVAILTPSWNLFTICNQLKQYPEAVGIIKKYFPFPNNTSRTPTQGRDILKTSMSKSWAHKNKKKQFTAENAEVAEVMVGDKRVRDT